VEDIASESSIICVTESHLDTNIIDNDILIDGFSDQILRKDRNCFGGGVLVYTSQDICVKPRYDLNFASGEIIWYEVIIPNFKILICTVYRPPGSVAAFWENFEYSIEQAMNYTSNIIINGDLNVDLLRENNNKLLEIISEFNLTKFQYFII
jgi:exonuclease III